MGAEKADSAGDELLVHELHGARILILNRPTRRNALTPELARALTDQIARAGSDESLNAVFLQGAGGHFSVGLDLKWVASHKTGLPRSAKDEGLAAFQGVVRAIVSCPLPVVAFVQGSVAGIGLDIAAACDLRVADTTLAIHSAFARMGLVPDGGSTYTLPRLVGQSHALALLLENTPIDAARASQMGLVTRVVEAQRMDAEIQACARKLSAQSRRSLIRIKQLVRLGERESLDSRLRLEGEAQLEALESDDFAARLQAFVHG